MRSLELFITEVKKINARSSEIRLQNDIADNVCPWHKCTFELIKNILITV